MEQPKSYIEWQKTVTTLQKENTAKAMDLSRICKIVREAAPVLLKLRKWIPLKVVKTVIDSILAIANIACPSMAEASKQL